MLNCNNSEISEQVYFIYYSHNLDINRLEQVDEVHKILQYRNHKGCKELCADLTNYDFTDLFSEEKNIMIIPPIGDQS
jgi:hypothetical protein